MSEPKQTSLDLFIATVERIKDIRSEANVARNLINVAIRDVECVKVIADSPYYNRTPTSQTADAAKRIRDQVKAEAVADAEHERDAKLSALAVEMESIRAVLPSLAARAAIDLGHQARMLAFEANGGRADV